MKTAILIPLVALALCGCASNNPLMTGNPKDWRGHPTTDLVTAHGQPTHILQQSDGEVWQYVQEWDAVVPKGSHASFSMGGFGNSGGSALAGGGGIESHEQYNAHYIRTDNFQIKDGIIKKWYGEIDQNGSVVWKRH
jgi:hypothetical protein